MKSDTVLDPETVIDFLCNISDGGFELYDPKFEIYFNSGITYGADNLEFRKIFGTDSLVFLPSSISEVIAVPQTAGEPEMLLAMVHEINETEVAPEERLTDSIYPMRLADGEYRLSGIRPR